MCSPKSTIYLHSICWYRARVIRCHYSNFHDSECQIISHLREICVCMIVVHFEWKVAEKFVFCMLRANYFAHISILFVKFQFALEKHFVWLAMAEHVSLPFQLLCSFRPAIISQLPTNSIRPIIMSLFHILYTRFFCVHSSYQVIVL